MEAIFKICKLANFPKVEFYIIFLESSGTYTINLKQKIAVIQNVRVIVIFYWPNGRLCCSPLTMAHTVFHDVGVETLYTDYSIGYTVRPIDILFRPCGLTLNKRNDRQRSPTAIMQTNSSMCMRRVRINVMGVVFSINDRRKRVSGRGLCEPLTNKNSPHGRQSKFRTHSASAPHPADR